MRLCHWPDQNDSDAAPYDPGVSMGRSAVSASAKPSQSVASVVSWESPTTAALLRVGEVDGDRVPDLAVAYWNASSASQAYFIVNRVDGSSIGDPGLATFVKPPMYFELGDLDRNGTEELGVVGVDLDGRTHVEVRSVADGSLIADVAFEEIRDLLDIVTIDEDSSPGTEIALLGLDESGRLRIESRDALTGARILSAVARD